MATTNSNNTTPFTSLKRPLNTSNKLNQACVPLVQPSFTYKEGEGESYTWFRDSAEGSAERAIPVHRFANAPMSSVFEHLQPGLQVEVPNRDYDDMANIGVYWVAEVKKVAGYRALLRYNGYEQDGKADFWMSFLSEDIHPVGWCAENGKPLVPPKQIEEAQEDWKQYLVQRLTNGRTLPLEWHKKAANAIRHSCRLPLNIVLEMIDRDNPSRVIPMTVADVMGDRVRLVESKDFKGKADRLWAPDEGPAVDPDKNWTHSTSTLLLPCGWATRVGYKVHANAAYLAACQKIVAEDPDGTNSNAKAYGNRFACPKMFAHDLLPEAQMQMQSTSKSDSTQKVSCKWEEGMKLECLDPFDNKDIHVATVKKVLKGGDWLQLLCDGASEEEEHLNTFPVHRRSPYIFPTGFCDAHAIPLNKPGDMESAFKWETYLRQTSSVAAPAQLFERPLQHDQPPHGFAKQGKMEAVDGKEPHLICPATVVDVKAGRLVRVSFDGWDASFDQWQDYRSAALKPCGWCESVGHKLEYPQGWAKPDDTVAASANKKSKN